MPASLDRKNDLVAIADKIAQAIASGNAGVAQLVERNLAKVEVTSSSLVTRSSSSKGKPRLPFFISKRQGRTNGFDLGLRRRDSKAVMPRIANPVSPVRLRIAPPK
jgi:hypothetical protein